MLPQEMTYTVYYRKSPDGELLVGKVTLTQIPGLGTSRQMVKAVKEKYGEGADLVASMGEKIATTKI